MVGTVCDIDKDDCFTKPCVHGSCTDKGTLIFACTCSPGYGDATCSTNLVNDCLTRPCKNGDCTDIGFGYTCKCNDGWKGTNCEEDIDDCAIVKPNCNHGKCADTGPGTFECACSTGWGGSDCTKDTLDNCQLPDGHPYTPQPLVYKRITKGSCAEVRACPCCQ